MKKRLLVFSADPGGAECISPVIQALPEDIEALILCKGTAVQVFKKYFRSLMKVDNMPFAQIEKILEEYRIDAVLTSSSSLPEKDMTEKFLWKWAEIKKSPSIAISDQWQNYARRFSGINKDEHLKYLPDKIAVQDKTALEEMINEGLPESRLCITGQPALESFNISISQKIKSPRANIFKDHEEGDIVITFFSQPIFDYFGETLGYTEKTVLNDILSIVPVLEGKWRQKVILFCKLHPKDKKEDLLPLDCNIKTGFHFIRDEYTNIDLIAGSDIVLGMGSIMIVHSVLAGIPTICYEPNKKGNVNTCLPVKVNSIPCITNRNDLLCILDKLRTDPTFKNEYLKRQKLCSAHDGAAVNVVSLIINMLKKNL